MPRKTYRAAVIGRTGRGEYGHGLDRVWLDVPQCELVAVADDDKMGLAAAVKRLGVSQAYTDYRRMLDEVKPDVVSIAPRWLDSHRDMVVETAERGVHIYMEKPMCRSLTEADEMVTACERSHVKLAIAHQTRHSPKLPVVRQLIEEGRLGRVLEYRGRGKEDRRGGGEDLWVLGTHIMDLTRYFAGDAQWCAANVTEGGRPIQSSDVAEGAEGIGPLAGDSVHAMFGLDEGAVAYFDSMRNSAGQPSRFALRICGTAGVLEIRTGYLPEVRLLEDSSWAADREERHWQNVSTAGVGAAEPMEDGGLHAGNVLAVKDLLAAIEEDGQPKGSVYDARAATEMIVAVFDSQRTGKKVSLPLANRENPLTMLGQG